MVGDGVGAGAHPVNTVKLRYNRNVQKYDSALSIKLGLTFIKDKHDNVKSL